MAGYTKLFNSILHSTIWSEPNETRILWITMLAMSDKHGEINAAVPGLARMAGLTVEQTQEGLEKFQQPDPFSRTPDNEGRRIEVIKGGWRLLNHGKYREMLSVEERREYNRQKQADRRKKLKPSADESLTVNDNQQCQHIADSDSDSKAVKKDVAVAPSGYSVPDCFANVEGFTAALAGWIEARTKKRNPPTGRAIQFVINRVSQRPHDAVAALDMAAECGWSTMKWAWFDRENQKELFGKNGDSQRDPSHHIPSLSEQQQ